MEDSVEAEVVVIGAGLAGLTAANRAASLGCSTLVVEKGEAGSYLCNSRIATGVLALAHSDPEQAPERLYRAINDDT